MCLLASAQENTKSKLLLVEERFLHIFATEQIRGQQGKKTFVRFINHAVTHPSLENIRIQFSCTYSINSLAGGQSPQIKMADLEKTESRHQDKTSQRSVTQKTWGVWPVKSTWDWSERPTETCRAPTARKMYKPPGEVIFTTPEDPVMPAGNSTINTNVQACHRQWKRTQTQKEC